MQSVRKYGFLYQGFNCISAKFVNCILVTELTVTGEWFEQVLSLHNCDCRNESLDAGGVVILFEGDSLIWKIRSGIIIPRGNEIAVYSGSASLTIRYLILQNPKG